ncbi:hypothetical protein HID58_012717 [Brassica napus]|uniref:Uncharacterized protein n=3 Tax=Brassica TaxID=3705 RepID=A0ABQ8E1V8_BRANA|nr:hypothetical protein HID58_012717 [Brassica napus]
MVFSGGTVMSVAHLSAEMWQRLRRIPPSERIGSSEMINIVFYILKLTKKTIVIMIVIALLLMAHIQLPSLHISTTFICILSVQISNPDHVELSMEAMKMKLFVAVLVVGMAFSAMQQAAAVEAPAPSPTSDASLSIPTFVATVVTMAFGFLF